MFLFLLIIVCIGCYVVFWYLQTDQSKPKTKYNISKDSPQVQLATDIIMSAARAIKEDQLLPYLSGPDKKKKIKEILDAHLEYNMGIKPALAQKYGLSYEVTQNMIEWTIGELYQKYIIN